MKLILVLLFSAMTVLSQAAMADMGRVSKEVNGSAKAGPVEIGAGTTTQR